MNVVIIYGGDSVEHDVSILTALHCAKHMPVEYFAHLVYLTRTGQMVTSQSLPKVEYYENGRAEGAQRCFFAGKSLYKKTVFGAKKIADIDAVINCCHSGVGEDGRLAGMFDVLGIPVTSCPHVVASNLQSKTRTREILLKNDFLQPGVFTKTDDIKFPCIVKPDTLGSSIGVTVVDNREGLDDAIELAKSLDDEIIIEQFLEGAVEINCSAFRFGDKVITSAVEIMDKGDGMLDFEKKYLDTATGFIKKGGNRTEPHKAEEEIKILTRRAYELFGATGVVRADFLVVGDKIYLNEINTVPGFLSYHLWQKSGLPYATLIEMLVEQAVTESKKPRKTVFQSQILEKNRFLVT